MAKVIGYKKQNFSFEDGKSVSGISIFTTYEIERDGTGLGAARDFISDTKLEKSGYSPMIGDEIQYLYNRYGKVDHVVLVSRKDK